MRSQKEHEELIEKYYPNGCILHDDMPKTEFGDINELDENKIKRINKFLKKFDEYCDRK
jgi:hypothetical protein